MCSSSMRARRADASARTSPRVRDGERLPAGGESLPPRFHVDVRVASPLLVARGSANGPGRAPATATDVDGAWGPRTDADYRPRSCRPRVAPFLASVSFRERRRARQRLRPSRETVLAFENHHDVSTSPPAVVPRESHHGCARLDGACALRRAGRPARADGARGALQRRWHVGHAHRSRRRIRAPDGRWRRAFLVVRNLRRAWRLRVRQRPRARRSLRLSRCARDAGPYAGGDDRRALRAPLHRHALRRGPHRRRGRRRGRQVRGSGRGRRRRAARAHARAQPDGARLAVCAGGSLPIRRHAGASGPP